MTTKTKGKRLLDGIPIASVRKIGTSLGITLPKSLLDKRHIAEGDNLFIIETDEGFTLSPYDPEFDKWAQLYKKSAKNNKDLLHKLAQ